ncbi:leucine-rich repeat-containing protein 74B-like [Mizuhopecten yessoensis]|uniref:EF-hand domain-containing protein n=1 Tax=Mizuhopecten yessoensis TaxID=6573 RepID=A0A210QD57_MIZYE|nr:leucine-rich repeat-containing protein 74B-like [Mizuhopecten yessoensis]OWF46621.1 hypothetical protein KP79_PYT12793 [Mizuhopecten yessoensis]
MNSNKKKSGKDSNLSTVKEETDTYYGGGIEKNTWKRDDKWKPAFITAGERKSTVLSVKEEEKENSIEQDIETSSSPSPKPTPEIVDDLDSSIFSSESDIISPAPSVSLSQTVYTKACIKLGLVPSTYFFKHLTEVALVMPHHGIGPRGAKAVAIALVPNQTIQKLDLSSNAIGSEGLAHVLDMLSGNSSIKELNISGNELLSAGAKMLKEDLSRHRFLTSLDISANGFNEKDADEIADLLIDNSNLRHLSVGHNSFSEGGGVAIGKALEENSSLQSLDLRWNHLRQTGAVSICWGLYSNNTLKSLNLSWNGFGMEGCHEMGKVLMRNRGLTELDLSANRIGLDAFRQLLRGIVKNRKLRTIRIGINPITTDGATAILRAVCASDSNLTEIDMTDVSVDNDFVSLLHEVQKQRQMKVTYGNLLRHDEIRRGNSSWVLDSDDPVAILFEYMKQKNLRLIDLLHNLDKDNSETLSRDELQLGLSNNDIPLSSRSLDILMKRLDANNDGHITFEELAVKHKEYVRRAMRLRVQADESLSHYKNFDKLEQIREAVKLKIALSVTTRPNAFNK